MKALPWFRMYTDFLNDPKMIALAFEDQRHFIGVLALKSEGVLDQDCDIKLRDRIVAQRLWLDYSTIGDVKKRLLSAGLIGDDWQPLAWDKRQAKSDHDFSGAERQKRFRERNALRNALGDGAVTPPEEIREEEKKKRITRTPFPKPEGVTDEVWRDFLAVRKAKNQPMTETALAGIVREATKGGYTLQAALQVCCERAWAGFNLKWLADDKPAGNSPWAGAK